MSLQREVNDLNHHRTLSSLYGKWDRRRRNDAPAHCPLSKSELTPIAEPTKTLTIVNLLVPSAT